jgi:DNA polymerase I-like protein with 3'-5' exonuclease and polymerase domains
MQNIPKKQEKLLSGILKKLGLPKVPKVRSCFRARPGWLFVESDYMQAELFTMAWYAQDEVMMGILSDPNRSLHYETAVQSYGLSGEFPLTNYTKDITETFKEKFAKEYVVAKGINFGVPYGLGALGLLMRLRAEGVHTTLAECKDLLEKHRNMYVKLHAFLDMVSGRVITPGYFQNAWGRRRRFVVTQATDNEVIAGMQRESKNFPIQSTVADSLSMAIKKLWEWKRLRGENRYQMLLPIHDAIISEVQPSFLGTYVDTVIPTCMSLQIPQLNIALGTDISVGFRWGEHATEQELLEVGVEAGLAKRFGKAA